MKLKLIPDYNREVDTVFLVSPLGLRDSAWGDFVKFLKILLEKAFMHILTISE